MSFFRKNSTLIIVGTLFAILLLIPSYILPSCPKGLVNDPFPGRCGLYIDENQDQLCDLSQTSSSSTDNEISPSPVEEKSLSRRNQRSATLSHRQAGSSETRSFNLSFAWQAGVFLTLIIIAIASAVKAKSTFRYFLLAVSLLFGFWTFRNLCPIAFLQFLLNLKDQAILNLFPFLIFLATIISTLIFGRIFCGWICPIGAAQEFVFRLPRWLKIKTPDLTKKVPPILRFSPLFVLAVIGLLVVRSGKTVFCQLDPFAYLFGSSTNPVLLGVLIILFFISLFLFRPFCLFLCPLGIIFSALSEVSIMKIKRNKKLCSKCKICINKCPTGAISKELEIDQKQCIRCQECLSSCPKKVLTYKS